MYTVAFFNTVSRRWGSVGRLVPQCKRECIKIFCGKISSTTFLSQDWRFGQAGGESGREESSGPAHSWDFAGVVNWFPGHMAKGTREVEEQIRNVNAIVEVRDARIPMSSQNPFLEHILSRKNRLVVFNKSDLADPHKEKDVENAVLDAHLNRGVSSKLLTLHVSCKTNRNIKKILPQVGSLIKTKFNTLGGLILVLGVPNVGKSTIINSIRSMRHSHNDKKRRNTQSRRSKTLRVGAHPGVTKNVSSMQVWNNPTIFMLDSPGIMLPRIEDSATALKLSLTGAIRDKIVGEETICEYLLYVLNKQNQVIIDGYTDKLQLREPTTQLQTVLNVLGSHSIGNVNACRKFLQLYRSGKLGRFCLDS